MGPAYSEPAPAGGPDPRAESVPDEFPLDPDLTEPPEWSTRAGRRNAREKLEAGIRGLKLAARGDSSFFAHAYRGLLIALAAALLGVGPMGWCLIVLSTALVIVAELAHSAVDTLARALGDPDETSLKAAREIATAGVLVSVLVMAATAVTVLVLRLGELLSW